MNKKTILLVIILFVCLLTSIFIHEVGHGISAYSKGYPVSTGFNKVGNAYAKPGDANFRDGFEKYKVVFDLGVIFTLASAILFTAIFYCIDSKHKKAALLIGVLAISNSVLRLIPMIISYSGFILGKGLLREDEVAIGLILNEMYDSTIFPYVITMASLLISFTCLKLTIELFSKKLPDIYISSSYFAKACCIAGAAAFFAANCLDRFVRINWVR